MWWTAPAPEYCHQDLLPLTVKLSGEHAHACYVTIRLSNRREFITLLGGTTLAWPLPAYAQQSKSPRGATAPPLVGFLNSASPDTYRLLCYRPMG